MPRLFSLPTSRRLCHTSQSLVRTSTILWCHGDNRTPDTNFHLGKVERALDNHPETQQPAE
eukprot:scaffold108479_cov55-Cyclotella_meneghiniana.AAC.1